MSILPDLPDHARIWIYPAERPFSSGEAALITERLSRFIQTWKAHGAALEAGFSLLNNQFIIIAVNEDLATATGCSIDQSAHEVRALEQDLKLSLTNRRMVTYRDGEALKTLPMHDFWAMRKAEQVTGETPVLDTTVQNLGELRRGWIKPFSESWHQQMWT